MPSYNPVHCAAVFFMVACIGVFAASLALPWSVATGTNKLMKTEVATSLWETCVTVTPADGKGNAVKKCEKFHDLKWPGNVSACPAPEETPALSVVWLRIQIAEGSAAAALGFSVLHCIAVALYAFRKTDYRFPFLVTAFLALVAAALAQIWWSTYLTACKTSFCDNFNSGYVAPGDSSSCGPGLGVWLAIGGACVTFVFLFPLFLITPPKRISITPWSGYDPVAATPQQKGQPQYQPLYPAPSPYTANPYGARTGGGLY